MIDNNDIKDRCSSCLVRFKNLPTELLTGAIYIENAYHAKINRYLRRWGWWLQWFVFNRYESGYTNLTYLPSISKKKLRKHILYHFPSVPKEWIRKIPKLKTSDLLDYLEDSDDARFVKPGFLFLKNKTEDGLIVMEYYPLVGLENKSLSYKTQIGEILRAHRNSEEKNQRVENRGIGHSGVYSIQRNNNDEYVDPLFDSLDCQTQTKVFLFKKQVEELQKCGVPMELLENILHQRDQLSKLIITKKYEILLPDYNNMQIKMEPLVKAVFILFLRHPEGIIFKHLPDNRQELVGIYENLRPYGLNERSLQSIEDVTNPLLNSINEKCARIRSAFNSKFDEYLAKYYYITGGRGKAKKIMLPRDLVIWE